LGTVFADQMTQPTVSKHTWYRRKKETTGQKYNGLPYTIGRP